MPSVEAIARQPKVFLLDEPLSNLDAQLRNETRAELNRLHARLEITTLYVTHDQVEAMTLADCLVVLDRGHIQQIGSPQEIYAKPANQMVASFLGSPPMNILPAAYTNGCLKLNHQSLPVTTALQRQLQPLNGQGFHLGIRPEHITVATASDPATGHLTIEVELVEPLGREVLVRGKLPNSQVVLNLSAPSSYRGTRGDRLLIELDLNQLFIFDASNGQTLYPND